MSYTGRINSCLNGAPFMIVSSIFRSIAISIVLASVLVSHVHADGTNGAFRLLEQYCSDCHGEDSAEGGFDLTTIRETRGILMNHQVAKRAIAQIRSRSMPPDDPRPSSREISEITTSLEKTLSNANWEVMREPVELLPSRMTRPEYRNTVRDIAGIDVEVSDLIPEDSVGANGFDNDRASLAMTESRLVQYLDAAQRVADTLIDSNNQPYEIQLEAEKGRRTTIDGVKNVKTLDDGTTGFEFQHHRGIKYQQVSQTIEFPYTGTYQLEVRAKASGQGKQGGLWIAIDSVSEQHHDAVILVDHPEFKLYSVEMFITAGHHDLIIGSDFRAAPWLPPIPERPQRKLPTNRDAVLDRYYRSLGITPVQWGELEELPGFAPPDDKSAATLIVDELNRLLLDESIRVYELFRLYEEHQFLPVNEPKGFRKTGNAHHRSLAKLIGVEADHLRALWLSHEPEVHLENERRSKSLVDRWHAVNSHRKSVVGSVFLDWTRVTGPIAHDGEKAGRIANRFGFQQESVTIRRGAERIESALQEILPRAYRRAIDTEDIQPFAQLYQRERSAGVGHPMAARRVLVSVFMSPNFLYIGGSPASEVQLVGETPLTNEQLASRLSYLFWKTTPDDGLAESIAKLDRSDVTAFSDLVDSIVKDDRADRFFRDFTSQWLGLKSLGREKNPDSELFREFSWQLAEDMRSEVALLLRDAVVNDRNLLDLIDGNQTFLNERLARLYGIESVAGVAFRSHRLESTQRNGLLGTAAVLTATSLPARTSPVQRGKFVIETLLGEDLPPPPEDAGVLDENAGQSTSTTLRQELATHRDNPSCIGCHQRIDPIGFALEKLDFVGRRRERSAAGPIDNVGVLASGQKVAGLEELNRYLRERRGDAFVDNLTRRLLAYCLGRSLDYRDEADVRLIVDAVVRNGNSAETLIREIVQSRAFLMRKRQ